MTLNSQPSTLNSKYTGRLAPSPTGYLHLGHARTFWIAAERARAAGGTVLLRNDDLDTARCHPMYVRAMQEDLRWLGIEWQPPMINQTDRKIRYRVFLEQLHTHGFIFPCLRSRRDVLEAAGAPHETDDEPIYPTEFRPPTDALLMPLGRKITVNWRFRVPDDQEMTFVDGRLGEQRAISGQDFGDFIVWRKDDTPSYQLATAVDDYEMGITEVVRGEDLIKSTFRQMLLLEALHCRKPAYYHTALVLDENGERLAKRNDAMSVRALREKGVKPEEIIEEFTSSL